MAPGMGTAEAPTKGLSALPSRAFGLAVYASPGGLPRLDARLASSRWSDATGRAFTRRVPTKGFRVLLTSHPPSPSFALRNHIVRYRHHQLHTSINCKIRSFRVGSSLCGPGGLRHAVRHIMR